LLNIYKRYSINQRSSPWPPIWIPLVSTEEEGAYVYLEFLSKSYQEKVSKCRSIWTPLAPTKDPSKETLLAKKNRAKYCKSYHHIFKKTPQKHIYTKCWIPLEPIGDPATRKTAAKRGDRTVWIPPGSTDPTPYPTGEPHNARALSKNSGHDWGSALVARSWPRGDFQLPAQEKAGDSPADPCDAIFCIYVVFA